MSSELKKVDNFIDNRRIATSNGKYIPGIEPATGRAFYHLADSSPSDADAAIDAAEKAFTSWSETTRSERSRLLMRIADLIEARSETLALAESRDQGKPVWLARTMDIPRSVVNFKTFASALLHTENMSTQLEEHSANNHVTRSAVGVCLLISPWNLPLYLLTFKMAPALACGNTVVCKPSELSSYTAHLLCDICLEAGLPPGVVNMVFGSGIGVGDYLVSDPRVKVISFTGSVQTAQKIRISAAPHLKKLSFELGGKNPSIIFDDCDLDKCVKTSIRSSFLNQGEICLCTSRIFVQSTVFEKFLEKFVEETRKLKVGNPNDDGNFLGALNSHAHLLKVQSFVAMAKKNNVKILCGLEDLQLEDRFKEGYFMRPTVLEGADDDSPLMQEEIFGPVVCISPFNSIDEVAKRANNTKYGLSACIWSNNINTVNYLSQKIKAGTIWVNCWLVRDLHVPFGGVKESGTGREGVKSSFEFYTESKVVCVQTAKPS